MTCAGLCIPTCRPFSQSRPLEAGIAFCAEAFTDKGTANIGSAGGGEKLPAETIEAQRTCVLYVEVD